MRRVGFWLVMGLLTGALTACPRGEDSAGALQVDILGLPAGTSATVEVTGPNGFARQLTQSETLTGLAAGSYTVTAGAVSGYTAAVVGSPATVNAGMTTTVSVTYQAAGEGGSISGTVSIVGAAGVETADFVPGEVIVKFRPGLRAQSVAGGAGLERVRDLSLTGVGLYRLPSGLSAQSTDLETDTLRLVAQLSARDDVLYAHPNYLLEAYAEPNDPLYDEQWHYEAINLPAAWDRTTGSASVTVAVLDSGVVPDHPDLEGKLVPGYDFVSGVRSSGDGDGRDGDPTDPGDTFHGSHVAGTVAAATDNGVGGAGVSWGARLLPVRVLGGGSGDVADAIDGILWSVGESVPGVPVNPNPADVLNLSVGGRTLCGDVPSLQDALDRANAAGAVVVVAAGNESADASGFIPASCGGVITVGATTLTGERAYYSNYGARIDVMAPGGDLNQDSDDNDERDGVLSTVQDPTTGEAAYAYFDGTSMASPHVAGVVALMKSVRPSLSGAEARDTLQSTARPITDPSCAPGCGAGLIDAAAALAALEVPTAPDFALSLSPAAVSLRAGASVSTEVLISRSGGFDAQVAFSVSGQPGGLSASFAPSATTGNSTRLTLSAGTGLEPGEYPLQVQGTGSGVSRTVSLSVVVEGDEPIPGLGIAGTYVFACPTSTDLCEVAELPAVQIETSGSSAPYTIPNVPAGDYNVLGWNDLNGNRRVDEDEPVGTFPTADTPSVVTPPASGVNFTLVPALGTQMRIQGSLKGR